ncbi:hypothetical protein [Nocardiopsis salina]|uniref:hypothetical protein n=1 Tax=Nocardiopsis salina TaxID=245836 RepID=UPI00034AC816|nr:hypothetical protein [Nocardiopsis salina]
MATVKLRLQGQEDAVEHLLATLRSDDAVHVEDRGPLPQAGGYVVVHANASVTETPVPGTSED